VSSERAGAEASPIELEELLAGYRPAPGTFDEMMDEGGQVRPHWRAFVSRLAALGPDEIRSRFETVDRYLKDSGVFYRVYDEPGTGERHWPLSHMPLIIAPDEWKQIEAGVIQRARLIEGVLADCYGKARLVAERRLPAAVIAGSPDYLRPLVNAAPEGTRHLFLYAVDLGRSPRGYWWVIRDRAQAPSGLGYALENRIALSRSISGIYRSYDVERLAPFFDLLRSGLARLREPGDAGTCLLSPGPHNETYFEHTYLARHLGLRLVEGVDLTVQEDKVYLRTVAGLRRVNALLRRVDGEFADPLELNGSSHLGVAGLVQVIRQGNVVLANALGSGLAEARALRGFLPALAEPLLGEHLIMPNVATWWCGQEAEREYVLDNIDRLVIAPAFTRSVAGALSGGPWVIAETNAAERNQIVRAIETRGIDLVGQETVTLSTTPAWADGRLEPHPFIFRVFVAATENGYAVMPGGFALIGDKNDVRAVSMQRGARSADVWVLSDGPVAQAAAPSAPRQVAIRRATSALPSRAADNLFWLARYIERAEDTLRLVRALAARLSERRDARRADTIGLADLLFRRGAAPSPPVPGDLGLSAASAMFEAELDGALPALVAAARRAAFVIRDRFPTDAWRALEDLSAFVQSLGGTGGSPREVYDKANTALRMIAAVNGFQLENMNRLAGWNFLKLGLSIERALATCRYVRQFGVAVSASPEELDLILELGDTQITYRMRYPFGAAAAPVLDLVLLDRSNPRALAFQLSRISVHLNALPLLPPDNRPTPALSTSERLLVSVSALDPGKVRGETLLGMENELMRCSEEISESYFRVRRPAVPRSVTP
jgi:uncharacterized circularly permuted ATP-grasp superfamily protein/uncharacterized alpha-E superfamily protein